MLDWPAVLGDDGIDAVAIAAPAGLHARLAEEALEAGKHVFVEKPLALAVAEAEAVTQLAERQDRRLMVGHLLQYHPAFMRLRELVRDGALGRLQYIYSNRLNLGKVRREEDILWSFAPHDISMILSLVGQEPTRIGAEGSYYLHNAIADVTTTHLAFPGGEQAHVFVSWLHPFKEQKLVVIGDRAMAVFDDGQPWPSKLLLYRHRIEWRDDHARAATRRGRAGSGRGGRAASARVPAFPRLHCERRAAAHRRQRRRAGAARADGSERRVEAPSAPPPPPRPAAFAGAQIHPTAAVDDGCSIGEGTKIWHFSHILARTRIGRNCVLGQNVVAGPDVAIGDNCKIQNNVSVYKGVTLEDGVFCGPSCVFTNVMNPRAEIERKDEFRPTLVKRGATIGANATIICGTTLGAYCFIGAGAVVTQGRAGLRAHGRRSPARRIGWVSHDGERLGPDLICPRSRRPLSRERVPTHLEEAQVMPDSAKPLARSSSSTSARSGAASASRVDQAILRVVDARQVHHGARGRPSSRRSSRPSAARKHCIGVANGTDALRSC